MHTTCQFSTLTRAVKRKPGHPVYVHERPYSVTGHVTPNTSHILYRTRRSQQRGYGARIKHGRESHYHTGESAASLSQACTRMRRRAHGERIRTSWRDARLGWSAKLCRDLSRENSRRRSSAASDVRSKSGGKRKRLFHAAIETPHLAKQQR
ncbi:hypothetical protein MRX96_035369 [Rhipicephalus microplus]